jgi:hypothetical protein
MKLPSFLLPSLLGLALAGTSNAAVTFSNLSQPRSGSNPWSEVGDLLATDFMTDATPSTILSLTARLGYSTIAIPPGTHPMEFSIRADDGSGKPGAVVGSFAPVAIAVGESLYTTTSPGISLQANTAYWIVGETPVLSLNQASWAYTESQATDGSPFSTLPGTASWWIIDRGGGLPIQEIPINGNFMFALDDAVIPEPPAGLGLLVTLGTFGALRWWRQRRVS